MNEIIMPKTPEEINLSMTKNVEQMGAYLVQMAQLLQITQNRLQELEEHVKAATVTHAEQLAIKQQIRDRAICYCAKYDLTEKKDRQTIAAAIKKNILTRYMVTDLHDCPQIALSAITSLIDRWTDIRLVMQIREKHREGGT